MKVFMKMSFIITRIGNTSNIQHESKGDKIML